MTNRKSKTTQCRYGHGPDKYRDNRCVECARVNYLAKLGRAERPPKFISAVPRVNKRDDVPTSVYVVECPGYVKIGLAEKVEARMVVIRCSCPLPVKLVAKTKTMPRRTARLVETVCHRILKLVHARGEWFKTDAKTALAALDEAMVFA